MGMFSKGKSALMLSPTSIGSKKDDGKGKKPSGKSPFGKKSIVDTFKKK